MTDNKINKILHLGFLALAFLLLSSCSLGGGDKSENDWRDEVLLAQECGENGLMCCIEKEPACKYGDCSISIVNIESLRGSKMSSFTLESPKPDTKVVGGRDIPIEIRKFERSSRNTPRARSCVELGFSRNPNDPVNRYDVFVEVKNADQLVEGRKVQSAHWKKIIRTALPGIYIPDTAVFEFKKLARIAQFMSLDELKARLESKGWKIEQKYPKKEKQANF